MRKISIISFWIGLLLIIFLLIGSKKINHDSEFVLWFISIILILFPGFGWLTKCPKCSRWFAEKEINHEVLRNWQERKKENSGEYTWYNCEERLVTYECPDCEHIWKGRKTYKNKA